MRIGEVAKITGVTKDTIRLYEKMGLIKEASRPFEYNNYKDYNADHVETIKMIIVMKELGLTLKECKEVIDSIESNKFDKEYQKDFIKKKMKEIDDKIYHLSQLKETLKDYLDYTCSHHKVV